MGASLRAVTVAKVAVAVAAEPVVAALAGIPSASPTLARRPPSTTTQQSHRALPAQAEPVVTVAPTTKVATATRVSQLKP